ncbi:MAG TPA: hypothetical protein VH134_16605, partial [Candidatus Dormibacteraeota bacterium]|nr:hypothetical protein [Candidatus Dormibacteraeota bacterium]
MRHIRRRRTSPRFVHVLLLALTTTAALSGCEGGGSSSTGPSPLRPHDGSRLTLAAPLTVESGTVSTPAMTTDPHSGRVYLAWLRESATAGPFGGHLGTPVLASSTDAGHSFGPVTVVQAAGDVQAPQVLAVTPVGTLLDAHAWP